MMIRRYGPRVQSGPFAGMFLTETSSANRRVIRGGSFQDGWVNLRVSKRGSAQGPIPNAPYDVPGRAGEHSSKIGFRCAEGE